MTTDELADKLRTDPALGVTIRLSNGMDEAEIWARAVAWAAQQEAEWAARTAQEFVAAPVEPVQLVDPAPSS